MAMALYTEVHLQHLAAAFGAPSLTPIEPPKCSKSKTIKATQPSMLQKDFLLKLGQINSRIPWALARRERFVTPFPVTPAHNQQLPITTLFI